MFYDLPHEIISYIFEFDSTFREIFDKVLQDIERYQVYSYCNQGMFYIFDTRTEMSHVTNSLEIQTWTTSFRTSKKDIKDIVILHNLKKSKKKLQYDISNFYFGREYQNDFHEIQFLD